MMNHYYLKFNTPMNHYVRLLVGWSVCHNFQLGRGSCFHSSPIGTLVFRISCLNELKSAGLGSVVGGDEAEAEAAGGGSGGTKPQTPRDETYEVIKLLIF